ncbi:MAG TPA: serine protease [Alphaproteobacteria bacterium]|nr:serine protease [Alphaproteobacteria bacterium]
MAAVAIITLLAVSLVCIIHPKPAAAGTDTDVVYCYDRARDVVSRTLAVDCAGEKVSEEEAKRISDQRNAYLKEALHRRPPALFGSSRIVSAGSGFFVTLDGAVVTNNHVIAGCKGASIETSRDKILPAAIVAVDEFDDLALLDTKVQAPAAAKFRLTGTARPHAPVAIVGYPTHGLMPIVPDLISGHVRGYAGGGSSPSILAVDADVRHGNSGSPILDQSGSVIGVVRAKLDVVKFYQETNVLPDDVGYGIPASIVTAFLTQHGIKYDGSSALGSLDDAHIMDIARRFVVRVDCWK